MTKLVIAGFGGQGVLSLGQFLALSGLKENKEVSYLPAYGPEMRGGTANCSVVISDSPIASPLCETPDILVAMNAPSLAKFASKVKSGGVIVINSALKEASGSGRGDVKEYLIDANALAAGAGTVKAANTVMAGAVCAATGIVSDSSIFECIEEKFGAKPGLTETNKTAYLAGFQAVKAQEK